LLDQYCGVVNAGRTYEGAPFEVGDVFCIYAADDDALRGIFKI
jgi:hypothetical protein